MKLPDTIPLIDGPAAGKRIVGDREWLEAIKDPAPSCLKWPPELDTPTEYEIVTYKRYEFRCRTDGDYVFRIRFYSESPRPPTAGIVLFLMQTRN